MPANPIDSAWPQLVESPIELRSVEYKRSAPWEDIRHHITKTALGMANLPNGGWIVVGVKTEDRQLVPDGMTDNHATTYDTDDVTAFVRKFAQPRIALHCEQRQHDGKNFVVIRIERFDDVPVICAKPNQDDETRLKKDQIYARPPDKVETRAATAEDLREILDLATDQRVRAFVERVTRLGPALRPLVDSDEERYDAELAEMLESSEATQIRAGAHHSFVIRPERYNAERLPEATELLRVADAISVRLNGWTLPMVLPNRDDLREMGSGYVGGWFSDPTERERWRLCQSGQIGILLSFYEDSFAESLRRECRWADDTEFLEFVEVKRLVAHCWGAVVLASRIAERLRADAMTVALNLVNIKGRVLAFSGGRNMYARFEAKTVNLGREWRFDARELGGGRADAATGMAHWFLQHFGMDLRHEQIEDIRDEVSRGEWR